MVMDYETTPGAPCWIELFTSDTEGALAFYRELLGWTSESTGPDFGGYINIAKDGKGIAGCMHNDGSTGAPNSWVTYLTAPGIEKVAEDAVENGGQQLMAPMEVMDLGTMALFLDPGAAAIGAWQPGTHRGFEQLGEIGTPYYFELHTNAYEASVDFYRNAFRWASKETSEESGERYTTLSGSSYPLAGIMDSTPGAPSAWQIYIRVDDTDASIERVVELGGKVIAPAEDSPYGRLAHIADPTGCELKIIATKSQ